MKMAGRREEGWGGKSREEEGRVTRKKGGKRAAEECERGRKIEAEKRHSRRKGMGKGKEMEEGRGGRGDKCYKY